MDGDRVDEALSGVLRAIRVRSRMHSRTEAREPWAVTMPPFGDCVSFHLVLAGRCRVEVRGSDGDPRASAVEASAGELVLVPHGRGHHLASGPGIPSAGRVDELEQTYLSDTYSLLDVGGDGPVTRLLCGVADVEGPAARRLLGTLPPIVHVDHRAPSATTQLRMGLDLLALELEHQQPGAAAVTPRLADVVVVLALRWWVEHGAGRDDGWVRALGDPHLVHALRAVHADPAADWTVASLAAEAGMSRSAFAERFARLTGDGPIAYVTGWRMQVARARLRDDPSATIAEVAASVGYGSEAAFSRAFSREIGHPPSHERAAATAHAAIG